jgi:hypothetical protein
LEVSLVVSAQYGAPLDGVHCVSSEEQPAEDDEQVPFTQLLPDAQA